jgi:hypothetical protein
MRRASKAITVFMFSVLVMTLFPAIACSLTGESTATPTPTLELKITPMEIEGKIIVQDSPLRSSPGKENTQLGVIKKGEKVQVVGISSDGNWYQIKTPASVPGVIKDLKVWISVLFVELPQPEAFPMPGMTPMP